MTDRDYFERRRADHERQSRNKVRNFRELLPLAVRGQTVCAGSSLMEYFPINELLLSSGSKKIVYNRGIAGATIAEYDAVLDIVLDLAPSRLFINIGSNDLNLPGDTLGNLIRGYRSLLLRVHDSLPDCKVTVLAYYPCAKPKENEPVYPGCIPRTMENIRAANQRLEELAKELGMEYLDVNAPLLDEEGYLREEYALDAIHFSAAGYAAIFPLLEPLF